MTSVTNAFYLSTQDENRTMSEIPILLLKTMFSRRRQNKNEILRKRDILKLLIEYKRWGDLKASCFFSWAFTYLRALSNCWLWCFESRGMTKVAVVWLLVISPELLKKAHLFHRISLQQPCFELHSNFCVWNLEANLKHASITQWRKHCHGNAHFLAE